MIISKTPYRISFFGGGSDFPKWFKRKNGLVLSASIDKFCYVTLRFLPKFFNHNYRIVYSDIENVKNISNINHPPTKAALKHYNYQNISLEIHYDGELPSNSGMGSSSSYTVGLINALKAYEKKKINKNNLALEAINIERHILREKGGYQDQIIASYGGFNMISFNKNNFSVKKINQNRNIIKLQENLLLLYTGFKRISSKIQESLEKKLLSQNNSIDDLILAAKEGKKILSQKKTNIDDFGYLLDYTWNIKKNIHNKVSNSIIDEIYFKAIKSGALGGKLLGAGGGGFMLFYVPKKNQNFFRNKFKKEYIISNIKFSNHGSQIIYNK